MNINIYIHIYIYIYIYIYTYIIDTFVLLYYKLNVYISNHENNVPSRSSPQWFCGNSCTRVHHVHHVHHVLECMSCHKAIAVITGRAQ